MKTTTTEVRIAVAKLTSIPAIPAFARIAVAAAKKADRRDHVSHVIVSKLSCLSYVGVIEHPFERRPVWQHRAVRGRTTLRRSERVEAPKKGRHS